MEGESSRYLKKRIPSLIEGIPEPQLKKLATTTLQLHFPIFPETSSWHLPEVE